jgi:hypothetical protein
MLAQQDDEALRKFTLSFGASQFSYITDTPVTPGTLARVKLFLDHPPSAIYCYAKATECKEHELGYKVTMTYSKLREVDQDLLIKAALYQQQKLLRQRSIERDNK